MKILPLAPRNKIFKDLITSPDGYSLLLTLCMVPELLKESIDTDDWDALITEWNWDDEYIEKNKKKLILISSMIDKVNFYVLDDSINLDFNPNEYSMITIFSNEAFDGLICMAIEK
jgi:hypothetical protein